MVLPLGDVSAILHQFSFLTIKMVGMAGCYHRNGRYSRDYFLLVPLPVGVSTLAPHAKLKMVARVGFEPTDDTSFEEACFASLLPSDKMVGAMGVEPMLYEF